MQGNGKNYKLKNWLKYVAVLVLLLSLALNVIFMMRVNNTMQQSLKLLGNVYNDAYFEMYEDNFGKEGIDKATEIILKNDSALEIFETYQSYPMLGKRYSVHNMAKLMGLIEAQRNSDISSEQQEEFVELVRYINDTLGDTVSEDKPYNFFFDKDDISGKLKNIEEKCETCLEKWSGLV